MPTYYRHHKLTTDFNAVEIDRTASYNSSTALTATFAIDNPEGEVTVVENPIYKRQKRGHLHTRRYLVGYNPGDIIVPLHTLKTGLWLQFGSFTAATAATTHTLAELSTGPYDFALHVIQKHQTTSLNLIKDALGCVCENIHLEWGQDNSLQASYNIKFAELVDGNSTARKTTLDAKEAFPAGQVSYKNVYNSTSFGATITGGSIDIDLVYKFNKGGNKYPTERIYIGKDYRITYHFQAFNKALFNIPNNPGSYATAITQDIRFWRSNKDTDFIRFSFDNVSREMPVNVKKIDEGIYIYEGTVVFVNSATSQGTCNIVWADPDISATLVSM